MGYRSEFEAAGIRHCDLYFDDCTVPDDDTVRTSLAVPRSTGGPRRPIENRL